MNESEVRAYVASINWKHYLEREQPLFVFAAFAQTYGSLLKNETGVGFRHQLYYFKNDSGIFYRDAQEMKSVQSHFTNLLDENDERVLLWLENEEDMSTKLPEYGDLEPKETIDAYLHATLYNPVIVYLLQACLEKTHTPVSHAILEKIERARLRSFYPYLMEHAVSKVFRKISALLQIPEHFAGMLTPQEILDVLAQKKKISRAELEKRECGCFFFLDESGHIQFYYGALEGFGEQQVIDTMEFDGQSAFAGKVRGIVKIINSAKHMDTFNKGDILVSINTNPSLMPVLKNAAAIVTDEGGITCHAAIVSRELRIPCITGTKIATKALKDGDYVEVDANTAHIKVLSRSTRG